MSVPVNLEQLAEALGDFTFAYLITVGDDFRAHAVAVDPVLADGVFEVSQAGRSTRRNAAAHRRHEWPPHEAGGYTRDRGRLPAALRSRRVCGFIRNTPPTADEIAHSPRS